MKIRILIGSACLLSLVWLAADPSVGAGAPSGAEAIAPSASASPAAGEEKPPVMVEDPLGGVPQDNPRTEAYSHGGYALFFVDAFWSIALLLIIVASGLAGYLQRLSERVTRSANLKVAVYAALLSVLTFLASLPVGIYTGFVREKAYGFANQTFAAWLGDQGKGLLVSAVLQSLFFVLLYIAIRRLGRLWWVAGSALGIAFLILVLAVAPVFIAPLFNTFTPLKDTRLRDEILALAHAQGIPAEEVYQVDASRQSEHNNAYVAGLLGTQRIVLYDTILRRFTPREIRFVMGHEMGHYVLHHIWNFVAFFSVIMVAGFLLVDRVARRVPARWPSLGIGGLAEPSSMPLLLLVLSVFVFLAGPAVNTFSRWQEHQADRFGLELTHDPAAAASSFIKFARFDLGEYEVNPWIEKILFSHPSLGSRIRYAQAYARRHPEAPPGTATGTAADGSSPGGKGR
jgi:STE24 endopeptidase